MTLIDNKRVFNYEKNKFKIYKCRQFKTVLEWDEENQQVIITYMDYLGVVQEDFTEVIPLVVGEQSLELQAESGIAYCLLSGEAGTYVVRTAIDGIDNGVLEVTLNG